MALPTMPSRWRHNEIEKQMQRVHHQQENFRNHWEEAVKYYQGNKVKANIEQGWTSDLSFRKSMDAYSSRTEKTKKATALQSRRQKLASLLQKERDELEAELRGLSLGNYARIEDMRNRAETLRSAREEKDRCIAQEKLYEHWQINNPELRSLDSELHRKHVKEAWGHQVQDKQVQKQEEREEELEFANEYEKARQQALENLHKKEVERVKAEKERAKALQLQMKELKEREQEAELLKNEEAGILQSQIELENLEAERKRMEKHREQHALGRFLHHQYKAQMRRRAQQIQEELELDRQILKQLMEEEVLQKEAESARQEKAKQDVAWMKNVLEEQLKLEQEREAELDLLYREEARQVWDKREEEWKKEREARERLMRDVLDERSGQLASILEENQKRQQQLIREREDLIVHLEDIQKTSRREKLQQEEDKLKRKQELERQVTARVEESKTARQQEEDNLKAEEDAEKEYIRVLKEEARRRREAGYQPGRHTRRKAAWE